jgi:hypothetical protein
MDRDAGQGDEGENHGEGEDVLLDWELTGTEDRSSQMGHLIAPFSVCH